MKKLIVGTVLAALLATQAVKAGDREWATAGKILTGVVVVHTLDRILSPRTEVVYVQQPAPVVVQTVPVAVAPQTVVVAPTPQVVYVQPVVYYPAPVVVRYGHWHHHYR
jgi:hypothetical protein